ncbi:hypothetical protein [Cupriavidus plantarum]|uniref:hypothetical protein n=3 Tax=Cupriavidus plantarum TaxID=942865 RepID=UPI00339D9A39
MAHLVWAVPALLVVAAIVSGRVSVAGAAMIGLLASVPVAMLSGVAPFGVHELAVSLARGAWIGGTIAPYVFGGLLFWQVASRYGAKVVPRSEGSEAPTPATASPRPPTTPVTPHQKRRQLFFASFLVGPFAESATGFGVGMLGTVGMLRHFGIAPRYLMVFALLSQTMIPWGGMSSGTVLAAAYARMTPTTLGLCSTIPVALLMPVWLTMFWRAAKAAGIEGSVGDCIGEALWIAAGMLLLAAANAAIGPETALLASYGLLIAVYFVVTQRPGAEAFLLAARKVLPFVVLISGLALARLQPDLRNALGAMASIAPFTDLPPFRPFLHAGIWLIAGAIVTAWLARQGHLLGHEARGAWRTGHQAILTALIFAMMAEVTTGAGISGAIASALMTSLHENAVLLVPLVSGAFGILANSGSPPNALFLPSLQALAVQASLSIAAVAAVQHVSGMLLGFFSPVRMTIAANLSEGRGLERSVYRFLMPYAVAAFGIMTAIAWAAIALY